MFGSAQAGGAAIIPTYELPGFELLAAGATSLGRSALSSVRAMGTAVSSVAVEVGAAVEAGAVRIGLRALGTVGVAIGISRELYLDEKNKHHLLLECATATENNPQHTNYDIHDKIAILAIAPHLDPSNEHENGILDRLAAGLNILRSLEKAKINNIKLDPAYRDLFDSSSQSRSSVLFMQDNGDVIRGMTTLPGFDPSMPEWLRTGVLPGFAPSIPKALKTGLLTGFEPREITFDELIFSTPKPKPLPNAFTTPSAQELLEQAGIEDVHISHKKKPKPEKLRSDGQSGKIGLPEVVDVKIDVTDYKTKDFNKGDSIGLDRFTERAKQSGKGAKLVDPKTKQYIEKDNAVNSGSGPHGCYWKLYNKQEVRIGSVTKEGKWLRK